MRLDGLNTMTVDPKSTTLGIASKIGLDCTVPLGPQWNPNEFVRSTVTDLGDPPAGLKIMTEEALTRDMEAFIGAGPRAWHEILKQYHGQPYPVLYRAFGNLRHKLGRTNDPPWYRYALSATPFSREAKPQPANHSDPLHIKAAG